MKFDPPHPSCINTISLVLKPSAALCLSPLSCMEVYGKNQATPMPHCLLKDLSWPWAWVMPKGIRLCYWAIHFPCQELPSVLPGGGTFASWQQDSRLSDFPLSSHRWTKARWLCVRQNQGGARYLVSQSEMDTIWFQAEWIPNHHHIRGLGNGDNCIVLGEYAGDRTQDMETWGQCTLKLFLEHRE